MTAHASQGKTLEAAVVDLCIGEDSSALTGYVALSRVRRKEDIWIFRPFPVEVFQNPPALGPHLLLDHLRNIPIDWEALKKRLSKRRHQESSAGESEDIEVEPRRKKRKGQRQELDNDKRGNKQRRSLRQNKRKRAGDSKRAGDVDAESSDSAASKVEKRRKKRTERCCEVCQKTDPKAFACNNVTRCKQHAAERQGGRPAKLTERCCLVCRRTDPKAFARKNVTLCRQHAAENQRSQGWQGEVHGSKGEVHGSKGGVHGSKGGRPQRK